MTSVSEQQDRVLCHQCPLVLRFAAIAAVALIASCSRQEAGTVAAPSKGTAQTAVEIDEAQFPRRLAGAAGTVVLHAPQIDQWIDHRKVQARVALEVTLQGQATLFGTGHVIAATETDLDARTVTLYDVTAERFVFSGGTSAAHEQAAALVRALMRKEPRKVPLDLFLNYLQGEAAQQHAAALNMEPPPIFVAYAAAILVITNGKPAMAPIKDSSLKFAVNTNWDLFQAGKQWYLRHEDQWLTAADPSGPWSIATQLPQEFSHLPDDANWIDARAWIPPSSSRALPQVFFVEKPAELILIDGKPVLEPIGELGIAYVSNTSSDVFKVALGLLLPCLGPLVYSSRARGQVARGDAVAGRIRIDPGRSPEGARARVRAGHARGAAGNRGSRDPAHSSAGPLRGAVDHSDLRRRTQVRTDRRHGAHSRQQFNVRRDR